MRCDRRRAPESFLNPGEQLRGVWRHSGGALDYGFPPLLTVSIATIWIIAANHLRSAMLMGTLVVAALALACAVAWGRHVYRARMVVVTQGRVLYVVPGHFTTTIRSVELRDANLVELVQTRQQSRRAGGTVLLRVRFYRGPGVENIAMRDMIDAAALYTAIVEAASGPDLARYEAAALHEPLADTGGIFWQQMMVRRCYISGARFPAPMHALPSEPPLAPPWLAPRMVGPSPVASRGSDDQPGVDVPVEFDDEFRASGLCRCSDCSPR